MTQQNWYIGCTSGGGVGAPNTMDLIESGIICMPIFIEGLGHHILQIHRGLMIATITTNIV